MDYTYASARTGLGLQTTVCFGSESYSHTVRPDGSTVRVLNPEGKLKTSVFSQRAFGDDKKSYALFSSVAGRIEKLGGARIPHETSDFEHYMGEGFSREFPELSAKLRINLDDVVIKPGDPLFRKVSRHIERASSRWGFATDVIFAVALAALIERPVTFGIYGALVAAIDLTLGYAFGSWKYAPTHAAGYLPARILHKGELLNSQASLIRSYIKKVDRLKALNDSVGNARAIEPLQEEIVSHFQMMIELFNSATHQKGLVLSVSDRQGGEAGMGLLEKILL